MSSPVLGLRSAVTSSRSTHFTLVKHCPLGTTLRQGPPCSMGSGSSFRVSHRRMRGASVTGTDTAYAPEHTLTNRACSSGCARASASCRATPRQRRPGTAHPSSHTNGSSKATCLRLRRAAASRVIGWATSPSTRMVATACLYRTSSGSGWSGNSWRSSIGPITSLPLPAQPFKSVDSAVDCSAREVRLISQ